MKMEHHLNMHEQIFKPITALIGTLAGVFTFTGILQGIGLFFGALTALFSALYWYVQWQKARDQHKWDKEDRNE